MRAIPDEKELLFHRFLAELRSNLREARSVDKTLRFGLRGTADFLDADDGACVVTLPPGAQGPRLRYALPPAERWDPGLLAKIVAHDEGLPAGILHAPLHRRGRVWGALVLRWRAEPAPWHLPALHRVAHLVSDILQRIDRQLLTEVRSRIDRKIMDRLRPRDLFYQILDGLRSLTRYDHSSALLVRRGRGLTLVAEQIAWRKALSSRIGETFAVDADVLALLEAGGVHGFDRDAGGWTDWTGHDAAPLARLLGTAPDAPRPEEAMIVAPLATRNGLLGVLKIACQHAGMLGEYEVELVKRFLPQVAVALQRSQLHESAADLEAKVLEAEKKSAMATLARGVAHDVNNTLGGLLLRVQQLRSDCATGRADPEALVPALERAEQGVQACRRIFSGMLEFARGAARAKGRVSVRRAVQEALALQDGHMTRNRVRAKIDVAEDLPVVLGRQSDLAQVFLNLVSNAVDAMPSGGELVIEGQCVDGRIEVRIRDTGAGIPAAELDRVQDPFVTTKEEGTGLGLPICRSLLADMGGELVIESEEGAGTTACVLLTPHDG